MQYKNIGIYYNESLNKEQSSVIQKIVSEIKEFCNVTDLVDNPDSNADIIVMLGGDGLALRCINAFMKRGVPFYGINLGTFGFFMNSPPNDNKKCFDSISKAQSCQINPLECEVAFGNTTEKKRMFSINDVVIFRNIQQTINLQISVNEIVRLQQMRGDGLVVCSPIGSSGYNFSLGGPILPISSNLIAITPAASFNPRNWRGAILKNDSVIHIAVQDYKERPAYIAIDNLVLKDIVGARIFINKNECINILIDAETTIEEKMIREQFLFK